jgi:acetyl-CoA carboxylase carboxyltransferase component
MSQICAPMTGSVVHVLVVVGQQVERGDLLLIIEAMKMEHEIRADRDAEVAAVSVGLGDLVETDEVLVRLTASSPVGASNTPSSVTTAVSALPNSVRADLQEVLDRNGFILDAARPAAIAKRHSLGLRTARENIADLCDEDSFIEYGGLAFAAQTARRSKDDLIRNTPADGMVTGIGAIKGVRCVVMAYDATVLAGTQGMRNHQKTDRMLGIALEQELPVVLFAEGGGGRPGDVDANVVAGLHVTTFASFARLSGQVPVVGIVAGRCFAGNAALLGCCDVIIATKASNIGMGGPAMVEGGGLGAFTPEQIGPSTVQSANGVIDILVDDETQAVKVAKHYIGFFGGPRTGWTSADAMLLREVLPENRVRSYDMREVMRLVADTDEGALVELRAGFGVGIFTALARIEGRPVGLIASNPAHLGGAIDADAADKAARFMQLCNSYGLPLVSLVDTPGFMVGPDIESQAQVRHVSRMFVYAAHLRVPFICIVLRKAYGLGAMAMAGGGFHVPLATVSWPSGEFGAMGLEGAVRLGFAKELAAVSDLNEREARFKKLVDQEYERGKAINMAATLEIDAVIDPAETRLWLAKAMASAHIKPKTTHPIDTW